MNFKKPSHADDSMLTDDDVIVRYENGEIIGITVLQEYLLRDIFKQGFVLLFICPKCRSSLLEFCDFFFEQLIISFRSLVDCFLC